MPVVAARRERAVVLEPRADAWSLSCGNEVRPEMSWFVEIKNEADHARISPVKMVNPTKDRGSQGGRPFQESPDEHAPRLRSWQKNWRQGATLRAPPEGRK